MGAFQELDQPGISSGLTKQSWRSTNASRMAEDIAGAIRLARSGRPGPVHIALPEDVLTADAGSDEVVHEFEPDPMPLGKADLHALMSHLSAAEKPLFITGASLAESRQPGLAAGLEDALGIPVLTMQSPRGLNDPSLGRLKSVLKTADMLVLIDKDIDFTLGFADPDLIPADKIVVFATEADSIARANNLVSGRLVWGCLADPLTTVKTLTAEKLSKTYNGWRKKVRKAVAGRPPSLSRKQGFSASVLVAGIAAHIESLTKPPLLIIDGGEIGQWAQAALPTDEMHMNGLSGGIGGSIRKRSVLPLPIPGVRLSLCWVMARQVFISWKSKLPAAGNCRSHSSSAMTAAGGQKSKFRNANMVTIV